MTTARFTVVVLGLLPRCEGHLEAVGRVEFILLSDRGRTWWWWPFQQKCSNAQRFALVRALARVEGGNHT